MTKDHNAKLQRLTCRNFVATHPKILCGCVPKVETENSRSIAHSECSSNKTSDNQDFTSKDYRYLCYAEELQSGRFHQTSSIKRLGVHSQKWSKSEFENTY